MSGKKKAQASSARAASAAAFGSGFGFGFGQQSAFQTTSSLSYVAEQPDLSGVPDPHVVVVLRNLSKRDSTTKSKAIEELQVYVRTAASLDDAVIAAWIALYPRLSIDTSRRVRQLAHTLQGSLTVATTKRILPHLRKAIGPWLSGLFDNDRIVERAAKESLELAFPTPDKRHVLWKRYRESLLSHAEDAILAQTANTLSDERSTSKDEAQAKYSRVVGSAMLMLNHLIQVHERDHAAREIADKLEPVISNKKLWEFAYSPDPYLRKSNYTLILACAQTYAVELNWPEISSAFIAKGLGTDQLGSSGHYIEALLALTKIHPSIWTSEYHAKQPASKKLIKFISKGSQLGPEFYWRSVDELIKVIPREALTSAGSRFLLEDAVAIATALREGLGSNQEPRQNLSAAWACYVNQSFGLQEQLEDTESQESFLRSHVLPVVAMYVDPAPGASLPPTSSLELAASIMLRLVNYELEALFTETWSSLTDSLVIKMKVSQPASSKDFESSQNSIVKYSSHLQRLRKRILDWTPDQMSPVVSLSLTKSQETLTKEAIELLKNRNGKPYGAAVVLSNIFDNQEPSAEVKEFLTDNLFNLLESPSSHVLVQLWQKLHMDSVPVLKYLSSQPKLNEYGQKSLAVLLTSASVEELENVPLVEQLKSGASDISIGAEDHLLIPSLLLNPSLVESSWVSSLLDVLLRDLALDSPSERRSQTLDLIDTLVRNPTSKSTIMTGGSANGLRTRLLLLSDSDDSTASTKASQILARLPPLKSTGVTGGAESHTFIRDQLRGVQPQLPILSLLDLALSEASKSDKTAQALDWMLPSAEDWKAAIEPFWATAVPKALSLTSPLQGTIYTAPSIPAGTAEVIKDSEGLSQLFRLTLYTCRLLSKFEFITKTPGIIATLWKYLPEGLHFFKEKLTLDSTNDLWEGTTPEVIDEAADVVSEGNAALQLTMAELSKDEASVKDLDGGSCSDYHTASIWADKLSMLVSRDGATTVYAQWEGEIESRGREWLNKSDNLLQSAVIISCLKEALLGSKRGKRLINDLVSDATDIKSLDLSIPSLRPLSLLNILVSDGEEPLEAVQSQRLVFLMQNLVRLLQSEPGKEWYIVSEVLRLLASLVTVLRGIYGEHWQQIFDYIAGLWEQDVQLSDDVLPVLHSSLRLYQKLKILATTGAAAEAEDTNEDLLDAWTASKARLKDGLLNCLLMFQPSEGGDINQPREITASLLSRLLRSEDVDDIASLYPLMSSDEETILETAYSLLHKTIPRLQEELSLEIVLEKTTAELPSELLELVSDRLLPSASSSVEAKRYLLSWNLLFDHFSTASYKLREAYVASLKLSNQLPNLLDAICSIIRISESVPVDGSKFEISTFNLTDSTQLQLQLQLQHLSIRLYYLALLYVPSLAKLWFLEQPNRIRMPLETWTQKHISPLIISATFSSVATWLNSQKEEGQEGAAAAAAGGGGGGGGGGDQATDLSLQIKFSHAARDLTASIAIDPESPPIAFTISLPASYPLSPPVLTSQTRVAVSERTWQSWLRTFQIIIFSTNSIIEGLVAFRRNVAGAIKGQGECAICYSVIGSGSAAGDMQTPNKTCAVCKNVFHGVCLYRWFRSSNASTCPLCRNSFNFG